MLQYNVLIYNWPVIFCEYPTIKMNKVFITVSCRVNFFSKWSENLKKKLSELNFFKFNNSDEYDRQSTKFEDLNNHIAHKILLDCDVETHECFDEL